MKNHTPLNTLLPAVILGAALLYLLPGDPSPVAFVVLSGIFSLPIICLIVACRELDLFPKLYSTELSMDDTAALDLDVRYVHRAWCIEWLDHGNVLFAREVRERWPRQ